MYMLLSRTSWIRVSVNGLNDFHWFIYVCFVGSHRIVSSHFIILKLEAENYTHVLTISLWGCQVIMRKARPRTSVC